MLVAFWQEKLIKKKRWDRPLALATAKYTVTRMQGELAKLENVAGKEQKEGESEREVEDDDEQLGTLPRHE